MKLNRIYDAAETECGRLSDEDIIRVYVASDAEQETGLKVFDGFQAEIEKLQNRMGKIGGN